MTESSDAKAFEEEVFAVEAEEGPRRGEVVTGEVVSITEEAVVVNVGLKADGMIPREEFAEVGELENLSVGDRIEVKVLSRENAEGIAILSRKEALDEAALENVRRAFETGTPVRGDVVAEVKGGYRVRLGPRLFAFLPASHASLKRRPKRSEVLNKSFDFRIKEFERARRNIVVSRRALLEAEREEARRRTLAEIAPGQVRKGVVKNVTHFGVFVDLGGIDGLVTLGDVTWSGFVSNPSDYVKVGETIDVKVLDLDLEKDPPRIRLGIKQAQGEPWEGIETRYPVGRIVEGPVKTLTPFGAFVEVEPGVDGLVHVSELSWTGHVKHPSEVLKEGEVVRAKVISADAAQRRLSLSIKQASPDPWTLAYDETPPGAKVKGTVTGVTHFGAFVRLPSGVEGLIHKSEILWDDEEPDPADHFEPGQEVEAIVLRIDPEERKIALGVKQLRPDPWQETANRYPRGKVVSGKVVRTAPEGVTVQLEENLIGFVPASEIARVRVFTPEEAGVREGGRVDAMVLKADRAGRRIVLSIKALERREEAEARASGVPTSRAGSYSLGEMLGDKLKKFSGG